MSAKRLHLHNEQRLSRLSQRQRIGTVLGDSLNPTTKANYDNNDTTGKLACITIRRAITVISVNYKSRQYRATVVACVGHEDDVVGGQKKFVRSAREITQLQTPPATSRDRKYSTSPAGSAINHLKCSNENQYITALYNARIRRPMSHLGKAKLANRPGYI